MAMKVIPADKNHRIKYLYDEEATGVRNGYEYRGIVIAIMGKGSLFHSSCRYDAFGLIEEACCGWAKKDYFIKDSYKGIAYCSVDDEFDLKEGMKIARGKLLNKYYKDEIAALDKAIKNIQGNLSYVQKVKADIQKILDNHSN